MSGWGNTALLVSDPFPDPRVASHMPIMTEIQARQFAKMALREVPGGRDAFHHVFGGKYVRTPGGLTPLPDTGVPWTLGQ